MATASHVGTAFYAFGLILLPALAFIGMVTCERVVQSGTEDYGYARRIAAAARLLLRSGAGAHPLSAQRPSSKRGSGSRGYGTGAGPGGTATGSGSRGP